MIGTNAIDGVEELWILLQLATTERPYTTRIGQRVPCEHTLCPAMVVYVKRGKVATRGGSILQGGRQEEIDNAESQRCR